MGPSKTGRGIDEGVTVGVLVVSWSMTSPKASRPVAQRSQKALTFHARSCRLARVEKGGQLLREQVEPWLQAPEFSVGDDVRVTRSLLSRALQVPGLTRNGGTHLQWQIVTSPYPRRLRAISISHQLN